MSGQVLDIDKGWKALRKALEPLARKDAHVRVGVMGEEGAAKHEDGISNAELALVQEFGTRNGHIPARPWIRGTFDANKAEYMGRLRQLVGKIFEGKFTLKRALGIIGAKMASDIKKRVKDGAISPPNAPSTLLAKAHKGEKLRGDFIGPLVSPKPLIDSSRMVNSVSWEVNLGGEENHGE